MSGKQLLQALEAFPRKRFPGALFSKTFHRLLPFAANHPRPTRIPYYHDYPPKLSFIHFPSHAVIVVIVPLLFSSERVASSYRLLYRDHHAMLFWLLREEKHPCGMHQQKNFSEGSYNNRNIMRICGAEIKDIFFNKGYNNFNKTPLTFPRRKSGTNLKITENIHWIYSY